MVVLSSIISFDYYYDRTNYLPKEGFIDDCFPTIQSQKHSTVSFSRSYQAAVRKPLLVIAIIEYIVPKINLNILMFHTVNTQCCG